MHRVRCFRWCRHVISWTVDVWSELVSLVSCILSPLPRFREVTCYRQLCLPNPPWWLTSVKLRMQSRCSLVYQTFLTNQDRPYTSVTEIAWNMQMSTNDNSINGPRSILLGTNVVTSILSATAAGCFKKKNACQFVFPRFFIFISARILVSATDSRLWRKMMGGGGGGGGLGAALGPQWGPGAKPLVGVWGQRPQKLKVFSVCHHKKTAFWSMKIRYLQVSKLYV